MSDDLIKIPETKKEFVINSEHADMIVNELLQSDFETLGRIFTDLVNYNVFGDLSITESECTDKAERVARRLLHNDSECYIKNFIGRSKQASKNRTAGQEPSMDEIKEYANAKGYDSNICQEWGIRKAKEHWLDQNGEHIKYWKQSLDSYIRGVNKNRLEDEMKNLFPRE